ncbi:helix-turn-helix domain-containing protein [Streptomyces sp. NBC_01264]|uniref:helix-turn-helix domain-containing protein n=1 Tax=Streptomyces sp. NBC_01264 TaxID=2903804 RepID=UPI00338E2BC1
MHPQLQRRGPWAQDVPADAEIARQLHCSQAAVRKWHGRFARSGMAGLTDAARSGRPRRYLALPRRPAPGRPGPQAPPGDRLAHPPRHPRGRGAREGDLRAVPQPARSSRTSATAPRPSSPP